MPSAAVRIDVHPTESVDHSTSNSSPRPSAPSAFIRGSKTATCGSRSRQRNVHAPFPFSKPRIHADQADERG
jgi:hypothetical protein